MKKYGLSKLLLIFFVCFVISIFFIPQSRADQFDRALTEKIEPALKLGVIHPIRQNEKVDDMTGESSSANTVSSSPEVKISLSDKLKTYLFIDAQDIQDMSGDQSARNYRAVFRINVAL